MAEQITFDRSLYSPEAVQAAAAAYAEHAKITVTVGDDSVEATISETGDHDPAAITHAFANHALHETIQGRRQAAIDEPS